MKTCPKCGAEYEDATTLCPADGAVLQRDKDALVGHTLANKYRIEERLDEGGMGTVYRATHVLMEKVVAIKVLHPSLAADDKIVARFTREAKAASRISHPHAINVTDFGEDEGGVVFLVMEYLRGQTLKDIVRGQGPMPLVRACEIIRQVCGALDAAHAEGVVHRDLKSDNIMLEEVGDGDWAKVLDFGIAKIQEPDGGVDPALTAPNLIIGTPQYMSPEQCAQASEIDSRSDIYSLGVILFEMLVGHVPFTGDSPTAIMMKHLQEAPPSVLEERKDVPPAVERVVARALAKRPEDRFQRAGELSEALALAVSGESTNTSAVAVGANPSTGEHGAIDTGRIVVPTGENEPARHTAGGSVEEEEEETTVVRSRPAAAAAESDIPHVVPVAHPEPPPASFNPWRIAVPAVAALIVVFAVVFALNRGSASETPEEQGQPLAVDPNSVPVQSASPATGDGERNITPGTLAPQPAQTTELTSGTVPANANSGENSAAQPSPTPGQTEGEGASGDGAQKNDNENAGTEPKATPTPVRRTLPPSLTSPTPADDNKKDDEDDAPPPPKPKAKPPQPTASPQPATAVDPPVVEAQKEIDPPASN